MKSIPLIIVFFFTSLSFSQKIETEIISKTPLQADEFLGADIMDNIYWLKNNILYKKTETETLAYSNINFGRPFSVDLQNPFKIIVFYKDYNTVIILDNKLNELTPAITFSGVGVSLINYASENNLWIYNKDDNILQLFDYQNKLYKLNTQPLNSYKENFIADSMISTYKNIWLYGRNGILQFNQYVSFIDNYPAKNVSKFFPCQKGYIILQNGELYFYNSYNKKKPVNLKVPGKAKDLYIIKDLIYIYISDTLLCYRLKY